MSQLESARGESAVARVVRPRSVAIIGASARPGSISCSILQGLKDNNFAGPIALVGRSAEPIDGHPVLASPKSLPEGIDLAVITLPASAVSEAIASCVERKVGAAIVLAAGFAETGAIDVQEAVAEIARQGGLAICGPNCIGFTNNVDGLTLHMRYERVVVDTQRLAPGEMGIAFVGQSGGILGHMQRAAHKRALPVSYIISTGNEAGLDLADYMEFLVADAATRVIVLYAEQIRRPGKFLEICERARLAGKPIVLLHPGRSKRARAAAQSHTGALVGDHGAMLTCVTEAGVLVVETMDEMIDVSELLVRYPEPPAKGPAVLTASGAFIALINDLAEQLDLEFPNLTPTTLETLQKHLPAFGTPSNPLDTTAGLAPGALSMLVRTLLGDPNIGSLLISFPIYNMNPMRDFIAGVKGNTKPVMLAVLGDGAELPKDVEDAARTGSFVFGHSSERALRALARYTAYGKSLARQRNAFAPEPFPDLPALTSGAQTEWIGKKLLAKVGIGIPKGALARSEEEARRVAERVGYPVALKAQASALLHKTEAGGVMLGVADEAALSQAWRNLHDNLRRTQPGLRLEGVLIEQMAPRGLELMIGAKRDAAWGPVLLLGLGGIWVEALGDVRIVPATATRATILEELMQLRSAALLNGFRGTLPVDVDAVAAAVETIGRLMLTAPSISEIDINPLTVYPKGKGAIALDALVVAD
jgi:acyl-CoA synthetase (NDP forming)